MQRIDIDTTVTGEYAKVAKFINAMEQDKFVFIIDQISLTSQESGVISLQIKFETFLKETQRAMQRRSPEEKKLNSEYRLGK